MEKTKSLKEEIDEYFAEYISIEKQMYESKDLDELKRLTDMLSQIYHKLFKSLVKLREEQKESFKLISKDITFKISKKNLSIHEIFERLEPNASGIGVGGFMLIKMSDEDESKFIEFREVTPINGTIDKYTLDDEGNVMGSENQIGPKKIAVPGEVKGLLTALEMYETLYINKYDVLESKMLLSGLRGYMSVLGGIDVESMFLEVSPHA